MEAQSAADAFLASLGGSNWNQQPAQTTQQQEGGSSNPEWWSYGAKNEQFPAQNGQEYPDQNGQGGADQYAWWQQQQQQQQQRPPQLQQEQTSQPVIQQQPQETWNQGSQQGSWEQYKGDQYKEDQYNQQPSGYGSEQVNSYGNDQPNSYQSHPSTTYGNDQENSFEQGHNFGNEPTSEGTPGGEGGDGGAGKRRRSRWAPDPGEGEGAEGDGAGGKKRKSRWAEDSKPPVAGILSQIKLPDFIKEIAGGDVNPEVQALNLKLLEINRRLQSGQLDDDRPFEARSPSPEPVYDNMGIRINTREFRMREKLTRDRQEVIAQLIKKNPNYKPPADYKPPKMYRKLFIPQKDYPGYNFIGLIIGPRGNTQKRMEKETGAKIVIRGKGSVKEGRSAVNRRDLKPDPSENEDLHVLVEADTQEAVDAAADMVEKLLVPVEEGRNEHKRNQLRELAALNGTIRDDEYCRLCGEPGHRQYECPNKGSTFRADVQCRICGDGGHPTNDCPQRHLGVGPKMDDEYKSFLEELQGNPVEGGGGGGMAGMQQQHQQGPRLAITGPPGAPPGARPYEGGPSGGGELAMYGAVAPPRGGLGYQQQDDRQNQRRRAEDDDPANLYVGFLPPHIDDEGLVQLFGKFGEIVESKIIKDRMTGQSKGFGFVKFADVGAAQAAVQNMNGFRIESKTLVVRVAGKPGGGGGGPGPGPGRYDGPPAMMGPGGPQGSGGIPPPQYPPPAGGATGPTPPGPYPPPYPVGPPGSQMPAGPGGVPPPQWRPHPPAGPPPAGGPPGPYGPPMGGSYGPPGPYAGYGAPPPGMGPRPPYGPPPPMGSQYPPPYAGSAYPGYPPQGPPPLQGRGSGPVPGGVGPPPSGAPGSAPPQQQQMWGGAMPAAAPAPGGASSAPPPQQVESEYERFMREMGK